VRLAVRLRQRKFGSRLLFKLAGIFALVGVLPGALIYTVSYQFVSRSVEAWFDAGVERALDAGLALGKGTLQALSADLVSKTRNAADRLAESTEPELLVLERLREQLGARQVALVSANGQVLSNASTSTALGLERPAAGLLREARLNQSASQIEGLEDDVGSAESAPQAQVRALARLPDTHLSLSQREDRYLMVVQPLPRALTSNALIVQAAYREYQQRHIARDGLRRMYIGTLTLSMVLSVLGAVVLAVLLGNQLARPLLLLAEGMRQVAAGDLGAKPVFTSRDEIGELTRTFADMTEQLGSARSQAERSMKQLDGARARLQTILDSLTAGVIMFDRAQAIDTVNPGPPASCARPVGLCRPVAERRGGPGRLRRGHLAPLRPAGNSPGPASATTGRNPSSCRWARPSSPCWCAAPSCPGARAWWCSTTSPSWCRPSAARPGARWRAAWPTRSRTRSRPSSSRPSACSSSSRPSSRAPTRPCSSARWPPSWPRCRP
jgi:nitrogen fixation/metabolism regulation signal transduction histidine kinase